MYNGNATGKCSSKIWKILWEGIRTMLSNIENLMARRRTLLCNFGKDYAKATGQCSAILENTRTMARQQDNALQFF
jgi:hypothetical protein